MIQLHSTTADWNRKEQVRTGRVQFREEAGEPLGRRHGERVRGLEQSAGDVRISRAVDGQASIGGGSSETLRIVEAGGIDQLRGGGIDLGDVLQVAVETNLAKEEAEMPLREGGLVRARRSGVIGANAAARHKDVAGRIKSN